MYFGQDERHKEPDLKNSPLQILHSLMETHWLHPSEQVAHFFDGSSAKVPIGQSLASKHFPSGLRNKLFEQVKQSEIPTPLQLEHEEWQSVQIKLPLYSLKKNWISIIKFENKI